MPEQEKTKVLFLCHGNLHRSPTGEHLLRLVKGYKAKSAGICQGARVEVSWELIDWADIVFVMEDYMKEALVKAGVNPDKMKVLDISNHYPYGSPKLVKILSERLLKHGIDGTNAASNSKAVKDWWINQLVMNEKQRAWND